MSGAVLGRVRIDRHAAHRVLHQMRGRGIRGRCRMSMLGVVIVVVVMVIRLTLVPMMGAGRGVRFVVHGSDPCGSVVDRG